MNKVFTIILCLGFGLAAQADYQCEGINSTSLMVHQNFTTEVGDSLLSLTTSEGTKLYKAQMVKADAGSFLSGKVFEIFPFAGDSFKLSEIPILCGRSACDLDGPTQYHGKLTLGETKSYFTCHEVQP